MRKTGKERGDLVATMSDAHNIGFIPSDTEGRKEGRQERRTEVMVTCWW
jgi:hypothetical protein